MRERGIIKKRTKIGLTCLAVREDAGVVALEHILEKSEADMFKDGALVDEVRVRGVCRPETVVEAKRLFVMRE